MRIAGPRKEGERWVIRWRDLDGTNRAFSRSSRDEVQAKKRELLGLPAHTSKELLPELAPLPDGRLSAAWFSDVIQSVLTAGHAACSSRDLEAQDSLGKFGRLLKDMSDAWQPHSGSEERDEELAKLVDIFEGQQRRGKANAAQPSASACINSTLAGRPEPPSTVH